MIAEQELVAGNSLFKNKYVYKYTYVRMVEGRASDTALINICGYDNECVNDCCR